MSREVGVHLRLTDTIVALAQQAKQLGLSCFQCFLIKQKTERFIQLSQEEINQFLVLQPYFNNIYLHSSYWVNLARVMHSTHHILQKEIDLAQKLGFSHVILHPGTTKGSDNRLAGIDAVARVLNKLGKYNHAIQIVLENTAYTGMAVGSDLNDFALLRTKLDKPEEIKFCIDTAHAHAYGYDIISPEGQEDFIRLLQQTIGIENIILLHVNDTKEIRGSYIDRHEIIGQGVIGINALKRFVVHPQLVHIPLMLELPELSIGELKQLINEVKKWE